MNRDIKNMVRQMTLNEKAELCSGASFWSTQAVDRLGIPSIILTDGPHGLRKQDGESDHLGLNESVPSTCFPSAAGLVPVPGIAIWYSLWVRPSARKRRQKM